jgi:hypothetical protein
MDEILFSSQKLNEIPKMDEKLKLKIKIKMLASSDWCQTCA